MIAPLAREDYEDLVAEGLAPTLEDFDRLNTIALQFQCGAETTAANAPRVGWAGDVPFHEPTFQAVAWYMDYAERVSDDFETKRTMFAFACHHAIEPHFFDALKTPAEIVKRVKAWADTLPVTREEVSRAVHFASSGFDSGDASARTPRTLKSESQAVLDRLSRKMNEGCVKVGLSFEELWTMTPSRLDDMIVAYHVEQGQKLRAETARIDCEYKAALRDIRTRLESAKKETDA